VGQQENWLQQTSNRGGFAFKGNTRKINGRLGKTVGTRRNGSQAIRRRNSKGEFMVRGGLKRIGDLRKSRKRIQGKSRGGGGGFPGKGVRLSGQGLILGKKRGSQPQNKRSCERGGSQVRKGEVQEAISPTRSKKEKSKGRSVVIEAGKTRRRIGPKGSRKKQEGPKKNSDADRKN